MKKISKRLVALVMALTMLVTSGVFVNAAAAGEGTNKAELLSEEAKQVIPIIADNIVNEAKYGTSESQEILDLIEKLPVYENGEERPDRKTVYVSEVKKAFNRAMNKLVARLIPDGTINHFLNHLTGGMYDLFVYLVPVEGEEDVYYFYCDYVDDNGDVEVVFTGARYDKKTGRIYGKDNNGIMGIGFDYDVKNYTVMTPVRVWMRDLGYSVLFDMLGEGLGFMKCDTVRVKFEHGGKNWMFQFWKGNYGFNRLNGAELGIYNKTSKNTIFYDCATDEEMLNMSTVLRTEDEVLIEREKMEHWWMCGFRFGPPVPKDELIMESTIEFKDTDMMNAFVEAAADYADEMTVSATGNEVTIIWQ